MIGRYFLLVTYWIEDFALWLRGFVDPPYDWGSDGPPTCAAHPKFLVKDCPHKHDMDTR